MPSQTRRIREALAAHVAFVRLFASMSSDMYCQSTGLNERLATAREVAFVVSCARMSVVMSDEVGLATKTLHCVSPAIGQASLVYLVAYLRT